MNDRGPSARGSNRSPARPPAEGQSGPITGANVTSSGLQATGGFSSQQRATAMDNSLFELDLVKD